MSQTMTQWDAFVEAICDNPEDDTPRLIFADWLDENGQPERAEFCRVQCELATKPDCPDWCDRDPAHCRVAFLERRERELLDAMIDTSTPKQRSKTKASILWAQPALGRYVCVWPHVFRRGFVAEITLSTADFLGGACGNCDGTGTQHAIHDDDFPCIHCRGTGRTVGHAGAIFRACPVEKVTLSDKRPFNPGNGYTWYPIEDHHADPRDLPAHLPRPIYDLIPGGLDGRFPDWKTWWGTNDDQQALSAALDALSAACVKYGQQQRKGKK